MPCVVCGGALSTLFRCLTCGSAARVGDFEVERTLAQHPHSRVYVGRARDDTRVAIKELVFSMVPRVEQLEAFTREVSFLRGLELHNTPRFIDSFTVGAGVETRLYLVQELIEGPSLLELLKTKRLTGERFDALAVEVLELLVALHGRTPKIIHRDIKPANLLFRHGGEVVLVDFGSARHMENASTVGSTLVGTFGYMSAEQLGGTVDDSSDLHALGATLLHAATGKPPTDFLGDGLHLQFDAVGGLTPKQRALLKRLTAQKREDRFSSAAAALAWFKGPYRPVTSISRGRRLVMLAAALVFATGAGLVATRSAPAAQATPLPPPAPVPAPPPAPPLAVEAPPKGPETLPSDELELVKERLAGLRGIFGAEKALYAEQDHYGEDFKAIGLGPGWPDEWCPDGARHRQTVTPAPGEVIGCHFIYGVVLPEGRGMRGTGSFTGYARGAIAPVAGRVWVVGSDGPEAGIPRESTEGELERLIARASLVRRRAGPRK